MNKKLLPIFNFFCFIYRKIFAKKAFFLFNKSLAMVALNGLGLMNFGLQESGELNFIKKHLPTDKQTTVFDIGAHQGNYSAMIFQHCNQATIYAFEPHPKSFQKLKQRFTNKNFQAFNLGAGSINQEISLYDLQSNDGSEIACTNPEIITEIHKGQAIAHQIKVIKLDDFITKYQINKIDLLKIDAEGYELNILKGLTKALDQKIIDLIQFEFNEMNVYNKVFFKDFLDLLGDNYDLFRLLPNGLLPLDNYRPLFYELFAFQNIIAIKKA